MLDDVQHWRWRAKEAGKIEAMMNDPRAAASFAATNKSIFNQTHRTLRTQPERSNMPTSLQQVAHMTGLNRTAIPKAMFEAFCG
jgi:hypothetical protein